MNRIQRLIAWAAQHSSKTKELHRFIQDLLQAMQMDKARTDQILQIANQLQADRDAVARLMFKFAEVYRFGDHGDLNMTNDEFRLFASARINQGASTFMGKPMTPENVEAIRTVATNAFSEVTDMGCPKEIVEDMQANFNKSFVVSPPEDEALAAESKSHDTPGMWQGDDIAVESSGG